DVRHGVQPAAIGDELMGAHGICLNGAPDVVEAHRARRAQPHAIAPVVSGDKVAAWIANACGGKLAQRLQHIDAEPILVREGRAWLEDTAIDAAPEVLHELSKQQRVDGAHDGRGVNGDSSTHGTSPLCRWTGWCPHSRRSDAPGQAAYSW